jgi:aminopeptidase-like protein
MITIKNATAVGEQMYRWAKDMFPINRSLTGPGVRETLAYLGNLLPGLTVHQVPSGTQVFDWIVPDEWTIRDAYIANESGQRMVDFQQHNLHIVGYSEPVNAWLDRDELDQYLYSLPDQPDAIPYITSYYERRWGFCLTHNQRLALPPGRYHAVVDSDLKPGVLNYAELIYAGDTNEEVLLSTYICHPSMANNELSGPVVTAALAQWLQSLEKRRYTYRILFIPETIGSIVYLSQNIDHLKQQVVAGFNITCIGDERCYSYMPSRAGDSLSDQVAQHVLHHTDANFKRYSWLDRGSDERQYCAPGIDLPIATIARSKYCEYPEYHTSLDNFDVVSPRGLEGGFTALRRSLEIVEQNVYLKATVLCEPQLGRRGLYPTLNTKDSDKQVIAMFNLISYCDGTRTLLEIANLIEEPFWELITIVDKLFSHGLLVKKTS